MHRNLAILLGIFLFSILLIPNIDAIQPVERTIKTYLNPFYRDSMTQNTDYNYTLNLNPPDGISNVKSAIVTFDMWINPTRNFTILVDGQQCNTPFYYVSTTYASAGRAVSTFDCSNRITHTGNYIITFRVSGGNIGASTAWLDLTYYNKPNAEMAIFGTEYGTHEHGKIWLQLINSSNDYVNDATCFADIINPNNIAYLSNIKLDFLKKGVYYFDFETPMEIGVYPVIAECYYESDTEDAIATSGQIWIGTNDAGSYVNTATNNNQWWRIDEALSGGNFRVDYSLNYTGITQDSLLTDVIIYWSGIWNGQPNENLIFSIYNYTSASWVRLVNEATPHGGTEFIVSNIIHTSNLSLSGIISNATNGTMLLRVTDTSISDATKSNADQDYFVIQLVSLVNPKAVNVKGSSEIHITSENIEPLIMETLCGTESQACAVFNTFNPDALIEGTVVENITIYSMTSTDDVDSHWHYDTGLGMDCTAIYSIDLYNGTEWVDVYSDAIVEAGSRENCVITMPILLNKSATYQYRIIMDNYMLWEVDWTENLIRIINQTLTDNCNQYVLGNFTFEVPITNETELSDDARILYCQRALDDIYWFYKYYGDSIGITTVGEYESYLLESRFYRDALYRHLQLADFETGIYDANVSMNILSTLNNMDILSMEDIQTLNLATQDNISAILSGMKTLHYIGGTEYTSGQTGKATVQFISTSGNPLNSGFCSINITYPNSTIFVSNGTMTYLSGSEGIYQYNFTVPSTDGVYISSIKCTNAAPSVTGYTAGTFHVADYILNYLITINGTIYQVNETQYTNYLSLLSAINYVNTTTSQNLQYLIDINGTVHQINTTINSKFQQILDFLSSINTSLNTTVLNYLATINGTTYQINQSQLTYYTSLLNAINSMNSSIVDYLVMINGTTYYMNSTQFAYYTSLLNAINSVNGTINTTILNYLIGINGTTYNTNQQMPLILQYLQDLNYTTNTTIPASLISINTTQNQHYVDIMNFLASINYTANTTLELKLDQINDTVVQINNTVNNLNFTSGFTAVLNAIGSVNESINTTVFNYLSQINQTTLQNQQYLLVINGTVFQINNSLISLHTKVDNLNITQYQQYLDLLSLLNQINATGNTTLEFVASINQSLLTYYTNLYNFMSGMNISIMNELSVINSSLGQYWGILNEINTTTHSTENKLDLYYTNLLNFLNSINYTLNTTLEYKLDLINGTVFQMNDTVATIDQNLLQALQYLQDINFTTNTTIPTMLISINNTQNQNYANIMEFLTSINFSINTTMEYKLDLINQTVFEIKDTTNQINYTVNNINLSQILTAINGVNTTVNQNQQYLISINDSVYQINQSQAQKFLLILQYLNDINFTTNTTLYNLLVTINDTTNQINSTVVLINGNVLNLNSSAYQYYQDLYVILKDINYTTNTTLENKLDFINSTTWQNYLILQNLTVGNLSVTANVNWTEGYVTTELLSFSDKINGEPIEMQTETLTCLGNTTLQHMVNGTKWLNGVWYPFNETTTEICQWGCMNNQCIPAPQFQYFYAFGFIMLIVAVIYVGWQATKKP